jgi:hypothetical protein
MLSRNFEDLPDIVYKCQWKFQDARAAFLVLYGARRINIPTTFLDRNLKADTPEARVTNVWWYPAFAMYMTNKCG